MVIKWGFGVEKETVLVGYNDNLDKFSYAIANKNKERHGHESSVNNPIGNYAYSGYDSTVWSPNGNANGYEIASRDMRINKNPKDTIIGFNADIVKMVSKSSPKNSSSEVAGDYKYKMAIPFSPIPNFEMRKYGNNNNSSGSHHFHMTMPYDSGDMNNPEKKIKYFTKLKKGLLNVRAVQPLFVALLGGSGPEGIGNPRYLEGSNRMVYTKAISTVGGVDLSEDGELMRSVPNNTEYGKFNISRKSNRWRKNLMKYSGSPYIVNDDTGFNCYGDIVKKKEFGHMEFRFFDTFDARGLYDVFKVMTMLLAHGNNVETYADPMEEKAWNEAMEKIAEEGWNAYVSDDYVKYLNKVLKIDIDVPKERMRADVLFRNVIEKVWKKSKNDIWVTAWIKDTEKAPQIHNFSKDSWDFHFLQKFKNDKIFMTKISNFLKVLLSMDTSDSSGKVKLEWVRGKYSFRDVMIDDSVLGTDYAAEDTEDILFALERWGIIKVNTLPNGLIDSIEKNFSSDVELKSKLYKMIQEKNILNEDGIGLLSQSEVIDVLREEIETPITPSPTPVRIEPIRPRPIVAQTVTGRGSLILARVPPESFTPNEDDLTDLDDMTLVLKNCNFFNEDTRQVVTFAYADIIYRGESAISYWKRVGRGQVIIYLNKDVLNQRNVSDIVPIMKRQFLSDEGEGRVFADSYRDESGNSFPINPASFFLRIQNIAELSYHKGGDIVKIPLNRAGISTLEESGIFVVSHNRGSKYHLVKKEDLMRIKGRKEYKILKNIPYHNDYYVQLKNGEYKLMKER